MLTVTYLLGELIYFQLIIIGAFPITEVVEIRGLHMMAVAVVDEEVATPAYSKVCVFRRKGAENNFGAKMGPAAPLRTNNIVTEKSEHSGSEKSQLPQKHLSLLSVSRINLSGMLRMGIWSEPIEMPTKTNRATALTGQSSLH